MRSPFGRRKVFFSQEKKQKLEGKIFENFFLKTSWVSRIVEKKLTWTSVTTHYRVVLGRTYSH